MGTAHFFVAGALLLAVLVSQSEAQRFHKGVVEQRILTDLLGPSYDKNIRAFSNDTSGDSPTIVTINMYVRSIQEVDDVDMLWRNQLTFRMEWHDARLNFAAKKDSDKLRFVTLLDPSRIWIPDLFFSNEIRGHFHEMLGPNTYVRISPNGQVLFSTRISLSLSCPMILKRFPFDGQTCSLRMASYGYTTDDIIFQWKDESPVMVTPDLHLPKFRLADFQTNHCDSRTSTGVYSCLRADFLLMRELSSYMVEVFIPCTMLVIIAWLTLWLEHHGPGAVGRLIMATLTLLVNSVLIQQMNTNSAPVSYTKAIDVWTGTCLTFVFITILQFIVVNYLARNHIWSSNESNIQSQKRLLDEIKAWRHHCPHVLDVIMRLLYPIAFFFFVVVYFACYKSA